MVEMYFYSIQVKFSSYSFVLFCLSQHLLVDTRSMNHYQFFLIMFSFFHCLFYLDNDSIIILYNLKIEKFLLLCYKAKKLYKVINTIFCIYNNEVIYTILTRTFSY